MTTCVYANCKNCQWHSRDISFHKFPSLNRVSKDRLDQWVKNCGNPDLMGLSPNSLSKKVICSEHFSENCYTDTYSKTLRRDAIPYPHDSSDQTPRSTNHFKILIPTKTYGGKKRTFAELKQIPVQLTASKRTVLPEYPDNECFGQDLNVSLKVEKEERSENFCRTCLKKSSTLIPLDSDDVEDSVNIGDKLVSCIPDIVWSDNNHSKLICTNCLKSLRISYNFRKTCISTNETFAEKPDYQNHPEQKDFASEYLQNEIKIEPAEHPGECLDYIPVDEIKAEEYEITESGSTYVGDPQELSYPNDDKNFSNQSATTIDVLPEIFSDQERGKRKSTCKYCLKSVVPSYLKHHERLHTGYKPYACGKCHETFRMQTMLNKHILKHHTEENSVSYNDMSIMMSM